MPCSVGRHKKRRVPEQRHGYPGFHNDHLDSSSVQAVMVCLHKLQEQIPASAGPAIIHKEVRAILVSRITATARPMIMWNHIPEGNAVTLHQQGTEHGRAIHSCRHRAAAILTHFDADRIPVTRAVEVSVLALLVGGHVLDRHPVINREMPDQVADSIATRALFGPQRSALESQGMAKRIRLGAVILRAVDRDVFWCHRPNNPPAVLTTRHHRLDQSNLIPELSIGNWPARLLLISLGPHAVK